jgi:hypothetical protein
MIQDKRNMQPVGPLEPKSVLQEGLRARATQQIVASYDLGHTLVGIVNNNCQVIGSMTITAGDREVPKIGEWGELVRP